MTAPDKQKPRPMLGSAGAAFKESNFGGNDTALKQHFKFPPTCRRAMRGGKRGRR